MCYYSYIIAHIHVYTAHTRTFVGIQNRFTSCMIAHTNAHVQTFVNTRALGTVVQVFAHTHTHTHTHINTDTYIYTCIHNRTWIHIYTLPQNHTCMHTYINTYTHTHLYTVHTMGINDCRLNHCIAYCVIVRI